jgi:hypothetical protein
MIKFLLTVLVLLASVVPSFATFSRINGLGIEVWQIDKDDTQIWLNPAQQKSYNERVWVEWPNAVVNTVDNTTVPGTPVAPAANQTDVNNNTWGGGSKKIGGLTGGLFIGQPYGTNDYKSEELDQAGNDPAASSLTAVPNASLSATPLAPVTPTGRFDAILSGSLDSVVLGGRVTYSGILNGQVQDILATTTKTEEDFDNKDLQLSAGVLLDDILTMETCDIAFSFNLPKAENTDKITAAGFDTIDNKFDLDNGFNWDVIVRGVWTDDDEENTGIVYFRYNRWDMTNKFTRKEDNNGDGDYADVGDFNYTQDRTQNENNVTAGVAGNRRLSENTLLISAVSINSQNTTFEGKTDQLNAATAATNNERYDQKDSTLQIPFNIGIEHIVSKALTTRAGVSKNLFDNTKTEADTRTFTGTNETARVDNEIRTDNTNGVATISIGAGVNPYKTLMIDAVVRQQIMFTGTYLISGVPETLTAQVTALLRY